MTGGELGNTPVIITPLRTEYCAVAGAPASPPVTRIGRGPARAAAWAADRVAQHGPGPILVAGVAGALVEGLAAGDLVVATEVRPPGGGPVRDCPSAPLLAGALRRAGATVHLGPMTGSNRVVTGAQRQRLGGSGTLATDTESWQLGAAAGREPYAVVRAIVDGPGRPLVHPGTIPGGLRALRSLRAAAPVLDQWRAALGAREIVLASPRSFCAGVVRAVDAVGRALERHGAPVYVRRQVVHNTHVIADLERRGAVFVAEVEEVPPGSVLVLAAHGVSPTVRTAATGRGLSVIDATCPLVSKVHAGVRRAAGRGDTVLLIGHREHEEVVGTVGEAPSDVVVVADVQEAARVTVRDPARVSYAVQTTLATDEATAVAEVLSDRFPALKAPRTDDICYATTNRQQAVRAVAGRCDLVLVLGSANSSNSVRLAEVAARSGVRAELVEDASGIDLRWLRGVHRIGLTAGASAPPHLVDDVVVALAGLGPVSVQEEHVTDENITFTLPQEVS